MKNKKFLIGILVVAIVAVGAVIYYGTGTNQQASIGNLLTKKTTTPTTPVATAPNIEKEVKIIQQNMASIAKKIQASNPGTGEKRQTFNFGNGVCMTVTGLGRIVYLGAC